MDGIGHPHSTDNLNGPPDYLITRRGIRFGGGSKQIQRNSLLPHSLVNRAVDRLILRCEQPFDLLIGGVHSTSALNFFFTLAA